MLPPPAFSSCSTASRLWFGTGRRWGHLQREVAPKFVPRAKQTWNSPGWGWSEAGESKRESGSREQVLEGIGLTRIPFFVFRSLSVASFCFLIIYPGYGPQNKDCAKSFQRKLNRFQINCDWGGSLRNRVLGLTCHWHRPTPVTINLKTCPRCRRKFTPERGL